MLFRNLEGYICKTFMVLTTLASRSLKTNLFFFTRCGIWLRLHYWAPRSSSNPLSPASPSSPETLGSHGRAFRSAPRSRSTSRKAEAEEGGALWTAGGGVQEGARMGPLEGPPSRRASPRSRSCSPRRWRGIPLWRSSAVGSLVWYALSRLRREGYGRRSSIRLGATSFWFHRFWFSVFIRQEIGIWLV